MRSLANIKRSELRAVLTLLGLTYDGTNGGHEKWSKPGMLRPVIFQTHKEPIPEFIVKNILRNIGITKQEFIALLEQL